MDQFERNLKDKFQGFEAEPPSELWSAIENQLDNKRRGGFLWGKVAAAVVFLVVSATALIYILPLSINNENPIAESLQSTPAEIPSSNRGESSSAVRGQAISEPLEVADLPHTLNDKRDASVISTQRVDAEQSQMELPIEGTSLFAEKLIPKAYPLQLADSELIPAIIPVTFNDTGELAASKSSVLANVTIQDGIEVGSGFANGFSLAAYLVPQQSYRYQRYENSFPFESLESEIFSLALGLHVSYKVNQHFEVQTGLAYNLIGQAINDIAVFSHPSMIPLYSAKGEMINSHPQSMITSMGGIVFKDQSFYFADITSSRIVTTKGSYDAGNVNLLNKTGNGLIQHFGYLEVPVTVRYTFFDQMISIAAKGGVAANFLINNNVYVQGSSYRNPIGQSMGVSTFNWSGTAGLALGYPINNRIALSLEPTLSMFLNPMGSRHNLTRQTYPYNYSLYMGLRYRL